MVYTFSVILIIFILILVLKSIKIVTQSEVLIVERLGKYKETLNAGFHLVVPFIDKARYRLSLRTMQIDSPPHPAITSDNVSINIDTVAFYKITDPVKAIYEVNHLEEAIKAITVTTLRDVIGSMELDTTLTSRDKINNKLSLELDKATDPWGVKIERVEVKNINPPEDVREAMEAQMRAERNKRAAILEAEGEREALIQKAEGFKRSQILKAEGEKESVILAAEAEGASIERIAKAKQEEINVIYGALNDAKLNDKILNYESIKALQNVANSHNKMVVPYESQSIMGAIASIKELKN